MKLKNRDRQFLSQALTVIKKGILLAIASSHRTSHTINNTHVNQQRVGSGEATSRKQTNRKVDLAIGEDNGGHTGHTPNDDRSDSLNPNNPAYQATADNRSNQMNPNNPAYHSSRGGGRRK